MNENDLKAQQPDSFEVYSFTTSSATYRYTSWKEDITIGANTFTAVPIKRSGFKQDLSGGTVTCNVQLPVTAVFADYIIALPIIPITVEIRRYYFDDLVSSQLKFFGSVKSLGTENRVVTAECVTSTDELNRRVPRFMCQAYCNNVFGDTLCGYNLVNALHTIIVTVDPEDYTILYSGNIDLFPDDILILGRAVYGDEERIITEFVKNGALSYIRIQSPIFDLIAPPFSNLDVYWNCNKSPEQCLNRWGNFNNFNGMPYVPRGSNPTLYGVI